MKFINSKNNYKERGFVISIIAFFVLTIMISISIAMSSLIFYRQQIATNSFRSTQSYYAAEAGLEDALIRLRNNPIMSPYNYNISINSITANVDIPGFVGSSKSVVSIGNNGGVIRTLTAVYNLSSQGAGFHYAAQVGDGGLVGCNNNCVINGNVFSSGNITGRGLVINDSAIIARNGNEIEDVYVKGNVLAYSCDNAKVDGNLTYVTGGSNSCDVGGSTNQQSEEIPSAPMPITEAQIDGWKSEAAAGTVINSNVILANGETKYLGPAKIVGNLTLNNNSSLILTGTVYVTGNIILQNNATIKLDIGYGPSSGVILMDGSIDIKNNAVLQGSGQTGSYIMILSTSSSDAAISVRQNVLGAVLYTSSGGITLDQNMQAHQITGYRLIMSNNVTLDYEVGLANSFFISGPGGPGLVTSWGEQ